MAVGRRAKARISLGCGLLLAALLPQPAVAEPVEAVHVDASPLGMALKLLARQTGTNILFTPDTVRGLRAHAVSGRMSVAEAVGRILAGSGLEAVPDGSGGLLVRRPAAQPVADAPQAGATDDRGSPDIVVTATRRAERLGDVPSSISVLSQKTLQDAGSQRLEDVIRAVPGVNFNESDSGSAALAIRGVTTSSGVTNQQSPVAMYFDEVPVLDPYLPWSVPRFQLFDVNRIEVLEGPQGTLFGAGALGGTIRVISNKPNLTRFEGETEATVQGHQGGAGALAGNGMVNIPLVDDRLALRAVGFYSYDGGWVGNGATGKRNVNRDKTVGGRAELLWKPVDNLSITGTVAIENDRPTDSALSPYGPKSYDTQNFVPQYQRDNTKIYNVTGEYRLPFATLTVSTSLLDRHALAPTDATTTVSGITGLTTPSSIVDGMNSRTFYEEVRLASSSEHPFRWLIGGLIQRYRLHSFETIVQPGAGAVLAGFGYPTDLLEDDHSRAKVDEDAIFGEISYDLTPKLTATAGVRVFQDRVGITSIYGDTLFDGEAGSLSSSGKYHRATPKFVLSYKPAADILVYASASQGFRAGQSNLAPANDPVSGEPIPQSYGPDQLWNYELGFKGSLGRRLTVNGSIYYIDWTKIQLQERSEGLGYSFIGNAGTAHIKGAELQLIGRPVPALEVGASLAYRDAKLVGVAPGVDALVGDTLPGSSKFTYYLYCQYDHDIGNGRKIFLRGDYSHIGKVYAALDNPTSLTYGQYSDVGAQLGFNSPRFDALVFATNLTNKRGRTNAFYQLDDALQVLQTPRTIGLTLRARY